MLQLCREYFSPECWVPKHGITGPRQKSIMYLCNNTIAYLTDVVQKGYQNFVLPRTLGTNVVEGIFSIHRAINNVFTCRMFFENITKITRVREARYLCTGGYSWYNDRENNHSPSHSLDMMETYELLSM